MKSANARREHKINDLPDLVLHRLERDDADLANGGRNLANDMQAAVPPYYVKGRFEAIEGLQARQRSDRGTGVIVGRDVEMCALIGHSLDPNWYAPRAFILGHGLGRHSFLQAPCRDPEMTVGRRQW